MSPAIPIIKSDIIISIRQPHLDHIVSQKKNHEFRGYLLPKTVTRFWIYEPSPASAIKYLAEVSNGKRPGEVEDGGFIRNSDFNEGKIVDGNFAYEILKLEALDVPITLPQLKARGWLLGAPQKYCYVKEAMALDLRDMTTTAISTHRLPIWPDDKAKTGQSVEEFGEQGNFSVYICLLIVDCPRHPIISLEATKTIKTFEQAVHHALRWHSKEPKRK